jgi:hypothetical protein
MLYNEGKKKREAPATNPSHDDYELIVLLVNIHDLLFAVHWSRGKPT